MEKEDGRGRQTFEEKREREKKKKRGSIERRNENRLIVARSGLTVFQSGSSA